MFDAAGCTAPIEDEIDIFYGQDLPLDDPEYDLDDFSLMNFDGNMTNLSDYEGQVLIVSFVYSRCPDVCPIVSANLRWVAEQLPDDYGTNFSIIAITVDLGGTPVACWLTMPCAKPLTGLI